MEHQEYPKGAAPMLGQRSPGIFKKPYATKGVFAVESQKGYYYKKDKIGF